MNKAQILAAVAEETSGKLRELGDFYMHKKSFRYSAPPLVMEPREDQLDKVRHPENHPTGGEALVAFEMLVDSWVSPKDYTKDDLYQTLGSEAVQVLRRYPSPEQQLIAALWCMGSEQCPANYDDQSIVIESDVGTYGIHKGKVLSKFHKDLLVPLNPCQVLETSHRYFRSELPAFVKAVAVARKKRYRNLELTITVLLEELTRSQFTTWVSNKRLLTMKERLRFERDILERRDPIGILYRKLVPFRMTGSEFYKIFGPPSTRTLNPCQEQRQVILNKLALQPFFK